MKTPKAVRRAWKLAMGEVIEVVVVGVKVCCSESGQCHNLSLILTPHARSDSVLARDGIIKLSSESEKENPSVSTT